MTAEKILSALNILFSPDQVVELRALGDRTHFGYYTDFAKLADDAEMIDPLPELKGIYITLNEVNPALLARCVNRVKKAGNKESQTGDSDIIRRRWFPIDIDAKRPAGISSSDEEHNAALHRAEQIAGFLSELGWPEPVKGDSGNGAHLLYRIDLPNDAESTQLIKSCLAGLSQIFSDTHSDVDTSVHNASRIWKLYGTTARKGDNTKERPYRKSCILSVPDEIETVPVSELIHLSTFYQEPESSKSKNFPTGRKSRNDTAPIDLSEWLLSNGLTFEEKPYSGGRLFVLDECPFSSAHKDGAYAIQFDSGAIFAGCHHNSCGGGSQRWSELRERFEGGSEAGAKRRPSQLTEEEYAEKRKQDAIDRAKKIQDRDGGYEKVPDEVRKAIGNALGCPPSDRSVDANKTIPLEATSILKDGNPFDYILKTFGLDHEGDETLAKCLIMSFASRSVINSKGLHVLTTGVSGKGKSHGYDTMLELIPQEFRLSGRLSDKSLFYSDDLKPRAAICLDDTALSEQMQEILKGVTTSFKQPLIYRTVNKDRKGEVRKIPERCVWWVAKMEGTGDDQVWNRMLTVWVDESKEQDDRVLERELEGATLPPQPEIIRHETLVCQQIWRSLSDRWVIIPYAKQIKFSSSENRRNPGMLLDIIRANAVLMQHQRECQEHNGTSCIVATKEDFKVACQLFQALNGKDGGQMNKLTRAESDLISCIHDSCKTEIKISDMQKMTGKSYSTIWKMLQGSVSHGSHYTGLLEKCPAISFLDRTDVSDNGETSKRNRVYVWDEELYNTWADGGGCWLSYNNNSEPNNDNDNNNDDGIGGSGGRMRKVAENFRQYENVELPPESENNNNNNNNFLENTYWRKNEEVYSEAKPGFSHIRDSPLSANTFPPSPSDPTGAPILESEGKSDMRKLPPTSANSSDFPPFPPSDHKLKIKDIDPDKFHHVDAIKGPCDCCGSKWIQYIENWYPSKNPIEPNLKVCQKCMEKAVTREVMSYRTLPGMVNTAGMTKVYKSIGKCEICGVAQATWSGGGMSICDICYERERRVNRGKAVV